MLELPPIAQFFLLTLLGTGAFAGGIGFIVWQLVDAPELRRQRSDLHESIVRAHERITEAEKMAHNLSDALYRESEARKAAEERLTRRVRSALLREAHHDE